MFFSREKEVQKNSNKTAFDLWMIKKQRDKKNNLKDHSTTSNHEIKKIKVRINHCRTIDVS